MSKLELIESDSPLVDWLSEHGKTVVWLISALFVILFLLFRLYSGSQLKSEKDYLEAAQIEGKIFVPAKSEASLSTLQTIVAKHPELEAEYDGLMAQAYLNQGNVESAAPLIARVNERIKSDDMPHIIMNNQIALEISQGKLASAYALANDLKAAMSSDKNTLYFFNLLRLGMLEQALGKKTEEKKSWDELLSKDSLSNPSFNSLLSAIDVQGASLLTFIQERQKKLNP